MKQTKNSIITAIITLIIFGAASCKRTNPVNPNDEELITTCKILFVDSAGVQPSVTATYADYDGDGGNPPSIFDTIKLKPNTTYLASILLLDNTKSPVDTVSNEILEEDDEHLFCYTISGANCTVQRTDSDGSYEVGLQTKWKTTSTSTGTAQVVLKHQPDVKNGSCAPGETDIDITYQLRIQ